MRNFMRYVGAASAVLLAVGAGQAGIPDPPDKIGSNLIVGVGVICNTGQQAELYMRLRADGEALLPAVDAVNEEAREPHACGMAAIAFRRDKTMDMQNINGRLVSIVRISVVAGYDGERWAPAPEPVQYTVMEEDGYAI